MWEIALPKMNTWEQIDGDMDPGKYGGTIAFADGNTIEMQQIQPVREYVGDSEAADVGFPFWTRETYFDLNDLDPYGRNAKNVKSALDSIDMDFDTLEADFTPEERGLIIANALLGYGYGVDEGPAGWSKDLGIPDKVKWWNGQIEGSSYIAEEDDEFRRDVLEEEDEEEDEDED